MAEALAAIFTVALVLLTGLVVIAWIALPFIAWRIMKTAEKVSKQLEVLIMYQTSRPTSAPQPSVATPLEPTQLHRAGRT